MQPSTPFRECRGRTAARIFAGGLAAYVLASAGCARRTVDPVRTDRARREDRRMVIPLAAHPRHVYQDVLHPRVLTRQTFRWSGGETEWEIRFPLNREAHAGFTFEEPLDISRAVDIGRIKFKITPGEIAEHLAAALISAPDENRPRRIMQAPLMIFTDRGWGQSATVSIPLSSLAPAAETRSPPSAPPMDWTRVNEFRLVLRKPLAEYHTVTVRHLRIQIN